MNEKERALQYHEFPRPGKISVQASKPCETAYDLSLAYSPGVAVPCLEIAADESKVYQYTSKGNLVAVISNGTAVLGLGNIGPSASKPVMEGKGVLFKSFADIDVFDLELQCNSKEHLIDTIAALAPTFGGINLEDIKAPECFDIETELQKRLDIPVFHDDQHGTAIIAAAALINALEITGRKISTIRLVISGAGAAALASAKLLFSLGFKPENLLLVDSVGVVYKGRTEGMNKYKEEFAVKTEKRTLEDAVAGSDVFFGLSGKDILTPKMLLSMSKNPIVFAMANPDPEINYDLAKKTRSDVIIATGRSDHPNQVNNVLGFPFIFRGALDVRARGINEEMKLAAVYALARLAKEPVPDSVKAAYGNTDFSFGADYLIPKPFDPRVLYYVSPAVADAAMRSGMARINLDLEDYTLKLKGAQNAGRVILRTWHTIARRGIKKRIVFSEGSNERVVNAAHMAVSEGVCSPVLVGNREAILAEFKKLDSLPEGIEIIDPENDKRYSDFVKRFFQMRCRKGVTLTEAFRLLKEDTIFSTMLLNEGHVDGLIGGVDRNYPQSVKPLLELIPVHEDYSTTAGLYIVSIKDKILFFADTTIHLSMSPDILAEIALMSADFAKSMNCEPRIAMLSYSNFGSSSHSAARMVREAVDIVRGRNPKLTIDGEMQADTASDPSILAQYPFSNLFMSDGENTPSSSANVFVFPDMQSGNISYKLLQRLGGARVIGPILLGLSRPAHILQRHASVDEIFNMTTVAAAQASLLESDKENSKRKVNESTSKTLFLKRSAG
ncbi:MAG TPA: NADP-dependent malic enzyme [Oligoflexia bacterium]|nr:NADP-dependent malic enzyme [Oligoflexia bacterium]HMP47694.1 NADP-dependent malic enzyme [Oligoflexia bacterium]